MHLLNLVLGNKNMDLKKVKLYATYSVWLFHLIIGTQTPYSVVFCTKISVSESYVTFCWTEVGVLGSHVFGQAVKWNRFTLTDSSAC